MSHCNAQMLAQMKTSLCLWKSKVLFSSRLSWAILLSLCSQVYCGLMLFNVIPIWEGEFLNFDISVSPSRRGKSRTSTGSCTKSPPSRGWPMTDALSALLCLVCSLLFHSGVSSAIRELFTHARQHDI